MIWVLFIIAILIGVFAIVAIVISSSMKKQMCIWVDADDVVRCVTRGDVGEITYYQKLIHQYLTSRAEESDAVSKQILNGQWNKKMPDDIGLTE